MIGKIKGTLVEIDSNLGLIETTGGVFYQVYLPASLTATLLPSPIEIYTYLHVREDAMILFGFETKKQHDVYKMLLTVPSVGPKTAYTVISFAAVDDLLNAIKGNDFNFFTRVPGLGKKTAMKIILELASKLESEFKLTQMYYSDDDKTVVDALVSLGFKTQEAKDIFQKLPKELSVEQKIKEGLKIGSNSS
ncbi:MAG: Holliday junction branch migration protein RuvA [Patescibacteria group bacterium]